MSGNKILLTTLHPSVIVVIDALTSGIILYLKLMLKHRNGERSKMVQMLYQGNENL